MTYPRKAGKTRPPQYAGMPVILIHYGMETNNSITQCSGEPFHQPRIGTYPGVPLVPCPLCIHFITHKVAAS